MTDYKPGVTADFPRAFSYSGKMQLSIMEVDGPEISKYGVVIPDGSGAGIAGWLKNLMRMMHHRIWPLSGVMSLSLISLIPCGA